MVRTYTGSGQMKINSKARIAGVARWLQKCSQYVETDIAPEWTGDPGGDIDGDHPYMDVRLVMDTDGSIHTAEGDVQYGTWHGVACAASSVTAGMTQKECRDLAIEMLNDLAFRWGEYRASGE